ncbi:MAG TPA: autotransporter-associated beta strand repeat-containing protein [Tepidisphaeraceae bacterium]|nr:autotransporter-associated beta strand repeat-containing protein [Tepidisphaeraceae bacterium]
MAAQPALATTYYWDTGSDIFQTAADWTTDPTGATITGSAVPGGGDIGVFNAASPNGDETISLNATESIMGLMFQNTGATTLQSSSTTSEALTLGTSGITINAGAGVVTLGSTTDLMPITLGGAQSWTDNATAGFSVVSAVALGTNALSIAGTGTTTISGLISGTTPSGTVALTVGTGSGSGTALKLTANNTFTGDISVNGGTLVYTGGTVTTTSELGLASISGTTATFKQVLLNNGATFEVSTNSYNDNVITTTNTGAGQVFVIGSGGATFNVDSGLTFTLDDGSGTGTASTNAELQGTGNITKIGTGTLSLGNGSSNFASFTGNIFINAGTLSTGSASTNPLGSGGMVTIASGAGFNLSGVTWTAANTVNISGNGTGAGGVIYGSTGTGTYPGAIVLNSNVTLGAGAGSIVLSGAISASTAGFNIVNGGTAGTGTGATTLSGVISSTIGSITENSTTSALTLSGANSAWTGGLIITKGTANLVTNASAAGPTAITLGDTAADASAATLNFTGNTTTTFANAINVQSGTTGTVSISNSSGNYTLSGLVTLNNNLTLTNTNTANAQVFNFTGGFAGTGNIASNSTSNSGITISSALNNSGTLTNSGTGNGLITVSGAIATSISSITQNSATSQMTLSGTNTANTTTTLTATTGVLDVLNTASLFNYSGPPASGKITVGAAATLGLGFGSTGQFTAADLANIISGALPVTVASGGAIGLDTSSASATLSSSLTNYTGGPSSGVPLTLAKLGTNTLTLSGFNTYTGNTNVVYGILAANDGVGLPANSLLDISASTINGASAASFAPASGILTRVNGTGAGQVEVAGATSGFSAAGTAATINLGGSGAAVTWGTAAFNPSSFLLNDTGATGTINFQNAIVLGASARSVTVNSSGYAGSLSGVLSGTGGGITKAGGGFLYITNGFNSFTGTTALTAGTLSFAGAGSLPTTAGAVNVTAGTTLQLLNDGSGSSSTIAQGNQINFANSSTTASTLYVANNGSSNTGNTIALGLLNNAFNSASVGYMNFNGSNGYSVSFTGLALPSGSGNDTRLFPNSAPVIINGNVTNGGTGSSSNYDSLYFLGTNPGNKITGVISDAATGSVTTGNYTRLLVEAANTVTLTGASTYTGGTFVGNAAANSGTLIVNGSLGGTLVTVQGGGTLGGTGTIGTGASTLQNTQGAVVVAGGATAAAQGTISLVDQTIGTLTIKGNNFATAAGQSLTLGGTAAGATSLIDLEENGTNTDEISLNGGNSNKVLLQLGGAVINILPIGSATLGVGTYPLINFSAGGTYTGAFTLGSIPLAGGDVASLSPLTSTSTNESLIVTAGTTAGAINAYWTGSVSAVWNTGAGTTATNFTSDYAGTVPTGVPDSTTNVIFAASSAGATNLATTLGQSFSINSLSFAGAAPTSTTAVSIGGTLPLTINAAAGFSDQNANPYAAGTGIVVQSGVTVTDTISAPLVLGGTQTWINNGTGTLAITGGVTGTGNLSIDNTTSGVTTLSAASLNIAGTITNNGSGAGATTLSGGIGSNVTAINQASTTSPLTISTTALTVNSGGTSLNNTSTALAMAVSGGVGGAGNLILNANSTGNVNFLTTSVNNAGQIINSGTGSTPRITGTISTVTQLSLANIFATIGTSVTGVYQNSATSDLVLGGVNSAYTGGITVAAGTLHISDSPGTSSSALGAASDIVKLGTTSANVTLDFNSRLSSVMAGATAVTGNATVAGQIVVGGSGTDVITATDYSPTFSGSVTLNNNLTVGLPNSGGSFVIFTGGIGGTGNITVSSDSTNVNNYVQFTTNPVSIAGTLTFNNAAVNGGTAGTGTGTNLISGGVGNKVTSINQASNSNPLTISTNALAVNSAGTTLTQSGTALFTVSGGVAGTGNLTLNNNNSGTTGLTLSTTSLNNIGTITNSGTGTAGTSITAPIATNVTGVIQNSATSGLTLGGASTYTTGTTVTSGYVQLTSANGAGTGPIALGGSGELLLAAGSVTYTNNISGSGYVEDFNGTASTSVLSGALSYTGNTYFRSAGTINFSPATDTTLPGIIGGTSGGYSSIATVATGSIIKSGSAVLTLSGPSVYTGTTTVNGGVLSITGSLGNTSVTVASNGSLGGSGTILGPIAVSGGGILAPSAPSTTAPLGAPLKLTGGLTLAGASQTAVVLASASPGINPSGYDQVLVGAPSTIGGTLVVDDNTFAAANAGTSGEQFWIVDGSAASATVTGAFTNGATVTGTSGTVYTITYNASGDPQTTGNDVVLQAQSVVPEPASLGLLAIGALGLLVRRRRAAR